MRDRVSAPTSRLEHVGRHVAHVHPLVEQVDDGVAASLVRPVHEQHDGKAGFSQVVLGVDEVDSQAGLGGRVLFLGGPLAQQRLVEHQSPDWPVGCDSGFCPTPPRHDSILIAGDCRGIAKLSA